MCKVSLRRMLLLIVLLGTMSIKAQDEGASPPTLDDEYAAFAERVPGFGGLYVDERGTIHVYLQDLGRAGEVQNLGEHVEVHQGQYDFRDLVAWKAEVRPLLSRDDLVSLDIDEERNRLVIGAMSDAVTAFQAELPSLLLETRVPPEAVIVVADEPGVPQVALTGTMRPVPAGVQIASPLVPGVATLCTLGVNATRVGVKGFVTNSHCSEVRGETGTVFFQSSAFQPDEQIGVETVDPPYFKGGSCPVGRKCRSSDAAFVAYDAASLSEGGQLANTAVCLPFAGPVVISLLMPRLPITGFHFSSPASGTIVTKVGRTTGCTIGTLKQTCTDQIVGVKVGSVVVPTNILLKCQNRSSLVTAAGDSGAPVVLSNGESATLIGIHWGSSPNGAFYSPWFNVLAELGGVFPDAP